MAMRFACPRSAAFTSGFALAWICVSACPAPAAEPTKVEDDPKRTLYGQAQKPPRAANPVLKSAELDTPATTAGPALDDEQITAILERYHRERPTLAKVQAAAILQACANREPASTRCDGELALLLLPIKKRKAVALYYARRAAQVDDAGASAQLYAQLAEGLRPHGEYALSAQAYAFAIAREDKAEFHAGRSAALQSIRGDDTARAAYGLEAADELATAQALQANWKWMREEAVLRARIPEQWDIAIKLMQAVAEGAPNEAMKARFLTRANDLRAMKRARDKAPKPTGKADTGSAPLAPPAG